MEIERCEEQGIDLPVDLCKRIEEMNKKSNNKVYQFDELKDGKGKGKRGKLTRYDPANNCSEMKTLSNKKGNAPVYQDVEDNEDPKTGGRDRLTRY